MNENNMPDIGNIITDATSTELEQEQKPTTISEQPEDNSKEKVKRLKRKKCQSSKSGKKCKVEKNGTDEGAEKEIWDEEQSAPFHIQPVSRGESFLNSSLLDEILSEKKRLLLESVEVMEFLRSRVFS